MRAVGCFSTKASSVECRWHFFCLQEVFSNLFQVATMIEEKVARLRAHKNNIIRYRWLLKTNLSDLERGFIERRLDEERSAVNSLSTPRPECQTASALSSMRPSQGAAALRCASLTGPAGSFIGMTSLPAGLGRKHWIVKPRLRARRHWRGPPGTSER